MFKPVVLVAACLVAEVFGHARVTTPTPRALGSATQAACGTTVYTKLKSDLTGPIENSVKVIDSAYNAANCPLYFCRGVSYDDNTSNTRTYASGAKVDFKVDLVAHHTGYANVSIVNVKTRTMIGKPVITWSVYADSTLPPSQWPANETAFTVTVPNLGTTCSTAGTCAIQWYWRATENSQTYENCVDFTQ